VEPQLPFGFGSGLKWLQSQCDGSAKPQKGGSMRRQLFHLGFGARDYSHFVRLRHRFGHALGAHFEGGSPIGSRTVRAHAGEHAIR
jgi:hypothetical protein